MPTCPTLPSDQPPPGATCPRQHPVCGLRVLVLASVVALMPALASALPQECGSLRTHFGPYDYTTDRSKLGIVESNHFTPEIENLVRGVTGSLGGELNYTLRAFPNHHRALVAITKYGQRLKSAQPGQLAYTISCFFERAIEFRPKDVITRMLYASYLAKAGRMADAETQLDTVRAQDADNPFTQYNLGLLYLEIGRHDRALAQAHKAMAMGMPRTELKDQLVAKGLWQEPAAAPVADSTSAPEAAPASAASR